MLNAHDSLGIVEAVKAAGDKHFLVLNVGNTDGDGFVRGALEPLHAVPRHVLDCEHGAICEDVEVQFAVGAGRDTLVSRDMQRRNSTYTKTRFVASIILGSTP